MSLHITSGGINVSEFYKVGSLRIIEQLARPSSATFILRLEHTDLIEYLTDENGERILDGDDPLTWRTDGTVATPGPLEVVIISSPGQTYRDAILDTRPWLYWPLDEADQNYAADYGEAAGSLTRRGEVDLTKIQHRVNGAMPYGAAIKVNDAQAITGPEIPSGAVMFAGWFRSIGGNAVIDFGSGAHLRLIQTGATSAVWQWYNRSLGASSEWHHVAGATRSDGRCWLWVDGVMSTAISSTRFGSGDLIISGPVEIDELSVWIGEAADPEVSLPPITDWYEARNNKRRFAGFVTQPERLGIPGDSDAAFHTVKCTGLGMVLAQGRATQPPTNAAALHSRQFIQSVLDADLRGQPITANGIRVTALLPEAFTERGSNLGSIEKLVKGVASPLEARWWVDTMGEIQMHEPEDDIISKLVLDDTVNIGQKARTSAIQVKSFGNSFTAGSPGSHCIDNFGGNGKAQIFELSCKFDPEQGIIVTVDGAAVPVDYAGNPVFAPAVVAVSRPEKESYAEGPDIITFTDNYGPPPVGARIRVEYYSPASDFITYELVDAAAIAVTQSVTRWDATANTYSRKKALLAGLAQAASKLTRVISPTTVLGKVDDLRLGHAHEVNARNAYGIEGGDPWVVETISTKFNNANAISHDLVLQQGFITPIDDDLLARLITAARDETLG